jgi:hypothetical protein
MQYQRAEELEREFNILIGLMAEMITSQAKQHDPTEEKGTDLFFGK